MLYWGFVQSSVSQVSHGGFALGGCYIDPSCSKNKGGAQKGAPSASIVTSLVNEGTTDVKLSAFTFKQLRGIYIMPTLGNRSFLAPSTDALFYHDDSVVSMFAHPSTCNKRWGESYWFLSLSVVKTTLGWKDKPVTVLMEFLMEFVMDNR